jgi:hypothetical protein
MTCPQVSVHVIVYLQGSFKTKFKDCPYREEELEESAHCEIRKYSTGYIFFK